MLNILCVIQTVVPSTEISIVRPFVYLEQQGEIHWQLVTEESFVPGLLDQVNVAVFHRNCHPNSRAVFDAVKAARIPVIYEIDDNYFEIPENLPVGRYMRNPYVLATLEHLLRSADIVKIGSPEMLPLISKYNSQTVCHPYAVDLSLLRGVTAAPDRRFTIGYAGTVSHQPDLEFVIEPIQRIAREFPHVYWEFVGCLPEGLKDLPRSSFTPFIHNYALFLQQLYQRSWRIGLCPMLDLPHNRCKTDNKLREYGACRIPAIFSRIPPYSSLIKHGVTGMLAENTGKAWYEALKTLITDDKMRNNIGDQVRKWVEEQRSVPEVAKLWLGLFRRFG